MNELNVNLLKGHLGDDIDVREQHIDEALRTLNIGCDKSVTFDEKFGKLAEQTVVLIASHDDEIVTFVK